MRNRRCPCADDSARDRRDRPVSVSWQLRIVLPVCRQQTTDEFQAQRQGEHQERQPLSGLGLCRSGQFCDPLLPRDKALLSAQSVTNAPDRGAEDRCAQAGSSLLLRDAGSPAVRHEAGFRIIAGGCREPGARGWLATKRLDSDATSSHQRFGGCALVVSQTGLDTKVSHQICPCFIGRGWEPTVFWGTKVPGGPRTIAKTSAGLLIQMGDWCGSVVEPHADSQLYASSARCRHLKRTRTLGALTHVAEQTDQETAFGRHVGLG